MLDQDRVKVVCIHCEDVLIGCEAGKINHTHVV